MKNKTVVSIKPEIKAAVAVVTPKEPDIVVYALPANERSGVKVGTTLFWNNVVGCVTTEEMSKPHPFTRVGVVKQIMPDGGVVVEANT